MLGSRARAAMHRAEARAHLLALARRHLLPALVIVEHVLALLRRQALKALIALGNLPLLLRRLIQSCLEKDPKNRLRDIGDWAKLLDERELPATAPLPARIGSGWRIVAAATAVVAAGVSFIHFRETPPLPMSHAAGRHRIQDDGPALTRHFNTQRLAERRACVRDDVVGEIFQRCAISQPDCGFEYRRLLGGSINSCRRRRCQADVRLCFLNNFRNEMIASQYTPRRIEEHQVRGSIVQGERRQRLQRQRKTRFRENSPRASPLEIQTKKSVAPNAVRIPFAIQRARNDGSIR